MAILITASYTKPTTETKFFNENNEAKELAKIFNEEKQKYRDNGSLLSERTDRTSDGLELSYASLWRSKEDYDHFLANEVCKMFWSKRNLYNKEHNIQLKKEVSEV